MISNVIDPTINRPLGIFDTHLWIFVVMLGMATVLVLRPWRGSVGTHTEGALGRGVVKSFGEN